MNYLIDTDWVIDHLNQVESVTARLHELAPEGLALSVVSMGELYEGVYYSQDPEASEGSLQRFLNRELTTLGSVISVSPLYSMNYNRPSADFAKPLSNDFNRLGEKWANRR